MTFLQENLAKHWKGQENNDKTSFHFFLSSFFFAVFLFPTCLIIWLEAVTFGFGWRWQNWLKMRKLRHHQTTRRIGVIIVLQKAKVIAKEIKQKQKFIF